MTRYINFDNAASTPPLASVRGGVNDFLNFYSSVHRGAGFKSQLSTWAYEQAREAVLRFVGADLHEDVCIFGKNTTEAINKVARRFPFKEGSIVLATAMEHHSNDLPFRAVAEVVHVDTLPDGRLDLEDFDRKLDQNTDRISLVAVTGANNVTGYLNPIHKLARKTHDIGAKIIVDGAQLAPHRKINIRPSDRSECIDFLAIAGHKMYAPFGTGALIGPREFFNQGEPDQPGGGTVQVVTLKNVTWAEAPNRDEPGSPNVVGAVALALAIKELSSIGMDLIAEHEATLTAYALERLSDLAELEIYGDRNPIQALDRLGTISFKVNDLPHALVAAILGHEFGIGVRSGCFCAHPYLFHLMDIKDSLAETVCARMEKGDMRDRPGLLRASFALYNTYEEIDVFVDALRRIINGEYYGHYLQDSATGDYVPEGWAPHYHTYFDRM
ncbi:MAG: aminotransferase class V-fold PLP-dependent enzyme [Anaerolineales bacterium]|nr:aminotransferase class V-fold PLP-dependent enzyme [Anaerolineales bacterium]